MACGLLHINMNRKLLKGNPKRTELQSLLLAKMGQ